MWINEDTPEALASAQPIVYFGSAIWPWYTVNYFGAAEFDVWQAVELVEKRYRIDPNRRYLSGFSMGCAATFRLAVVSILSAGQR